MSSEAEPQDNLAKLPLGNSDSHLPNGDTKERQSDHKNVPSDHIKLVYLFSILMFALMALTMASLRNPDIYEIDKDTLLTINQAFNALILLIIPFLLGILGAISRILIAGVKVAQQLSLVFSSGLMAAFSWMGIKSGVLLSIVAPHLEKQGVETNVVLSSPSDFYTMALVAIFVGMFSTNLYLFINQKVEHLTLQGSAKNPNNKKQADA